ncbi:hypothetical protein [Paraconexibacter sp.]|uniref:hypothetical protein n=1 Tax=Paraconexibacter sp. TaxID=2949640 RepID=UPI00356A0622
MSLRRDLLPLALLAAVAVLAAVLCTVFGVDSAALHFTPALVVLLPLLAGRYLGEERLAAVVAAFAPGRRRAVARISPRTGRAPRRVALVGGRLLAAAHAERGPPVALAAL